MNPSTETEESISDSEDIYFCCKALLWNPDLYFEKLNVTCSNVFHWGRRLGGFSSQVRGRCLVCVNKNKYENNLWASLFSEPTVTKLLSGIKSMLYNPPAENLLLHTHSTFLVFLDGVA